MTYGASPSIAYISGRISETQWTLETATGTTPANAANATVSSINRAFASLSSAFSGATNASHLNTANLVTANTILNLPCYYDSGPDTVAATLPSSITTGASNYVNIFTPNNTSTQANFSQRDNGMWTPTAYSLVVTNGNKALDIQASYVHVTGLQMKMVETATTTYASGIYDINLSSMPSTVTTSTSQIIINSNILTFQTASSTTSAEGIENYGSGFPTVIIANNIAYGMIGSLSSAVNVNAGAYYIYNNTAYDNYQAYEIYGASASTTVVLKNNIAQDDASGGYGSSDPFLSASSTNNISDHNDVPGTDSQRLVTVAFVSTSTDDFRLAGYDNIARGNGANLTSDPVYPLTYDFTGATRPSTGAWDVGAIEFAAEPAAPPSITSFTVPATSTPTSIPFLSFVTTSTANPVAAYLVSTSSSTPGATSTAWTTSMPTSFDPNSVGTTTVYAWVTDAYGNISAAASATTYIYPFSATVTYAATPTDPGLQIPSTFMGLSYEQGLNNPLFGQPGDPNPIFIQLINNLLAYGAGPFNIRYGGISTDETGYPSSTTYSQLAEIAKDVNTRFEIGINLATDSIPLATAETQAIVSQMPSGSLDAIEIGNEPEGYPWYTFGSYETTFSNYAASILPLLPNGVKLMGPSFANTASLSNLPAFLTNESSSLSIISQHWYAGDGALNNASDYLLQDSAVTSGAAAVSSSVALAHADGLPFRMGEMNSLYEGGEAGISNAFGSALWTVDTLFNFANVGVDGVNLHSGTGVGTSYSPFTLSASGSAPSLSFAVTSINPEYYGMLLFQQATQNDARLIPIASTTPSIAHLDAWATVDASGTVRVVLINRNETTQGTVNIDLPGAYDAGTLTQLLAPSYESETGVTLGGQTFDGSTNGVIQGTQSLQTIDPSGGVYAVTISPTSAAILTIPATQASVPSQPSPTVDVAAGGVVYPPSNNNASAASSSTSTPATTSSSPTTGTSIAQLETLLASLQAQLVALQARVQVSETTAPLFTRNLSLWSTGSDVQELQQFLISQNSGPAAQALAAHGTTETFGALTLNALIEFQKKVGIVPASGYFGPETRAWIIGNEGK